MSSRKGEHSSQTTITSVALPDGNYNLITTLFTLPDYVKAIQIIDPSNVMNISTDGGTKFKPHAVGAPFDLDPRDGNRLHYIGNISLQGTTADVCSCEYEE